MTAGIAGEVAGDVGTHHPHSQRLGAALAELLAGHASQPHRRGHRGADQPRLLVVGRDGSYDDGRVAQLGTAEQHVERVDQVGVGAAVDREGAPVGSGVGCLEIADDVTAAEGVDRLFRVADQNERGVAVEGETKDVPLHRIRVLELVDQHHPEAGP